MICGLALPTAGRVTVNGIDVERHPEEAQHFIGYLADFFSLDDDLKVSQKCLLPSKTTSPIHPVFALPQYAASQRANGPFGHFSALLTICALLPSVHVGAPLIVWTVRRLYAARQPRKMKSTTPWPRHLTSSPIRQASSELRLFPAHTRAQTGCA
jgi:hypothetical protein